MDTIWQAVPPHKTNNHQDVKNLYMISEIPKLLTHTRETTLKTCIHVFPLNAPKYIKTLLLVHLSNCVCNACLFNLFNLLLIFLYIKSVLSH